MTAIAGFGVLVLSDIRMLRDFGLVTLIDLSVSLLGVLVALPAALLLARAAASDRRSDVPRLDWSGAHGRRRAMSRPEPAGPRYGRYVGVLVVLIVVLVVINTALRQSNGVGGVEPGHRLPPFAVPLALGRRERRRGHRHPRERRRGGQACRRARCGARGS